MSPGHYKQGIMILVLKEFFHVPMCAVEITVYCGAVFHLGVNPCSLSLRQCQWVHRHPCMWTAHVENVVMAVDRSRAFSLQQFLPFFRELRSALAVALTESELTKIYTW